MLVLAMQVMQRICVVVEECGAACNTIKIQSKVVEVKGKHGELKRVGAEVEQVVARMYFAKSKQCSMLNSVCSHISNLFEGVAQKFEYKMHLVYAHFPINANIINGGKTMEIRNFLGEKVVRTARFAINLEGPGGEARRNHILRELNKAGLRGGGKPKHGPKDQSSGALMLTQANMPVHTPADGAMDGSHWHKDRTRLHIDRSGGVITGSYWFATPQLSWQGADNLEGGS
ncbi:60S ribosomal protein L9 [Symbiodinium microadriaticum]|uniref:60S ribosomal protein L9 n=1 Tax=Symbiodinium microadriaticum TaxID=2951 RepID=A0A1Q9C804_SYMMI|nr:60S ribosomal protein L9 [Symbiodinium microadriaticum]